MMVANSEIQREHLSTQWQDVNRQLKAFHNGIHREAIRSPKQNMPSGKVKLAMKALQQQLAEACQAIEQLLAGFSLPDNHSLPEDGDTIQIFFRELQKQQRAVLLQIIDILDRTDQLKAQFGAQLAVAQHRHSPVGQNRELSYAFADVQLYSDRLTQCLHDSLGVYRIDLQPGDYPDPTLTRIAFREDAGVSDEIEIKRVLDPAFQWQEKVLRKAYITVISRQE